MSPRFRARLRKYPRPNVQKFAFSISANLRLFVQARCADLSQNVLLNDLLPFINDVHQPYAVAATMGQDVGDIEVAERGDEFPSTAVELPDFVLVETIQSPVSSRWSPVGYSSR